MKYKIQSRIFIITSLYGAREQHLRFDFIAGYLSNKKSIYAADLARLLPQSLKWPQKINSCSKLTAAGKNAPKTNCVKAKKMDNKQR